jgi:general transcription factor 3C polypeptide 5 (transcription factor C subunit 1)
MPVQNVLLRVTVPKRTGRKRKRGSDHPFEFHGNTKDMSENDAENTMSIPMTAEQLRRRLIDNMDTYTTQPVATIKQTHRFRALPDFQLRAGSQPVMHQIGKTLVNPTCKLCSITKARDHPLIRTVSSIKGFKIDMTPGRPADEELIAPPNFTSFEQSLNYLYKQNPGVTHVTDEVPTKPPKGLRAIEKQSEALQQCVKNLLELLETRPAVTRRVACNLVDWGNEALFKEATQYVGYSFKSGPFRDTLVKYGLDPRADPKYRCYQTFSFQLVAKDKVVAAAKKMRDGKNQWIRSDRYKKDEEPSHVFDGKSMTTNGKTWQVCDIKEPVLAGLLATENLRPEFDVCYQSPLFTTTSLIFLACELWLVPQRHGRQGAYHNARHDWYDAFRAGS